jgi:hypothetical protein
MRWIKHSISAIIFAAFSSGAYAQDSYSELAQMLSTQQAKAMQGMFSSGMIESTQNSFRRMLPGGDSEKAKAAAEKMRPALDKFKKGIESAMLSPETQLLVRNAIELSLRKVYTQEEAQAQINFFRSPQGASIYEKTGTLTLELGNLTPQLIQSITSGPMRELMQELTALKDQN